jgi:hypothetical protein
MHTRFGIPVATATLALLAAVLPTATTGAAATAGETLANARDATAAFNDPAAAQAAGYDLLTDAAGIACIDQPGSGAMGVHYVKGSLVQAGTIDAARPQAVVYEVRADGRLQLVALEYVVLKEAWDAAHSGPPSLFGETFMTNPAGNRFGLPAFYALHAWIWKHNPSGTFNPWNPAVQCGGPVSAAAASDNDQLAATAYMCAIPTVDYSAAMPASEPREHKRVGHPY